MITRQKSLDESYMETALELARKSATLGEIPIGAVLVHQDRVVATAHNLREISKNPLDHAEMRLLAQAAQTLGDWRLNKATLYVTLEPCPMCLGALLQARVGRLVFGSADPKREKHPHFPSLKEITSTSSNNHTLEILGGVLAEESEQLLKFFFQERRK